ncbi:hypothetical protein [Bacillus clarus]|uniref:Uncharacterized protein n=1 Tax=Bacillus clarus TaxID=2338372 RepID=A0A090Z498_9BACI|nr:hypothetical protein [Bacillus clarus]KFM99225.1 hypothetical protein DJ93_2922 [Bacillus clarus]
MKRYALENLYKEMFTENENNKKEHKKKTRIEYKRFAYTSIIKK